MSLQLIKNTKSTESGHNILNQLNDEQKAAVIHKDGPLLIIAGAGSGKTRVLTYRIAYLIENGINPNNILALTFTNKAAGEMKDRIAKIVDYSSASKVWAGTFHSIFARILRKEAISLGYTSSFSIYDSDDSLSVIRSVMNSLNISSQQFSPQSVRSKISWAKNQMISWQEFSNQSDSMNDKQSAIIYEAYENKLKQSNAMDFDDLLINFIHVLRNSPQTLSYYQRLFNYIMVDEYQDTNKTQYEAVKLLASSHKNIVVVGDDAQSIYKWRGADIKNILDFQKDYPNTAVIKLEQNYRSTKTILAAADSVIKYNRNQLKKSLWTNNPDGEKIDLTVCSDDREEAEKIYINIKKNKEKDGFTNKDFCVLYRTNAQSLSLENIFRKYNMPYLIIGGMSFYKRKEVKDTLAYLKLLVNTKDEESLLRCVNEPPRGIGATSIGHIKQYASEKGISLFDAFLESDFIQSLQKRAVKAVNEFAQNIKGFIDTKSDMSPGELVLHYIEGTGMLQMYREMDTEESMDRWNNIQQLVSDISDFFRREPNMQLEDYLMQISLVSDIDEKDTTTEHIKLMTLHSAKGLEFPVVFIAGLENGLFPLMRADWHNEEEEEERRLFYVGITRAEQKLYLSYCTRRSRFGEIQSQSPSKFISEIDKSCFNQKNTLNSGLNSSKTNPYSENSNNSIYFDDIPKSENYSQLNENNKPLKSGIMVKHSQFGVGKIESISGEGNTRKAVVYFKSVGRKNLMLQYAKLEPID